MRSAFSYKSANKYKSENQTLSLKKVDETINKIIDSMINEVIESNEKFVEYLEEKLEDFDDDNVKVLRRNVKWQKIKQKKW